MTQWLTIAEAAAHLRARDHRIIRDAIARGEIPAFAYGSKSKPSIRLKVSDIDAWLEGHPWEESA